MQNVVDLLRVMGIFEHALTYFKGVTMPTLLRIYWDWEEEQKRGLSEDEIIKGMNSRWRRGPRTEPEALYHQEVRGKEEKPAEEAEKEWPVRQKTESVVSLKAREETV